MCADELSEGAAGIALAAHVAELRGRCEAAARLQGGSTHYHEELGIFREYASEAGLYLAEAPRELSLAPDDEGNEHQVWFEETSGCYRRFTPSVLAMRRIDQPLAIRASL
jgi:hypothetical protein